MPAHHSLEEYLHTYLEGTGIAVDRKSLLFRSAPGHAGVLTDAAMARQDAYRMIARRAITAGIRSKIGCHSFRATGITQYLTNDGKLEIAQQMANHESSRTHRTL
jgi:integrase